MTTAPNHSVEANRRPAAPPEAGQQFGSPFSARPNFPAAVAHLWRSARMSAHARGDRGQEGRERADRIMPGQNHERSVKRIGLDGGRASRPMILPAMILSAQTPEAWRHGAHRPNHSVEANRRPAAPLGAGQQFGSSFSARPSLPAAVAHLCRYAD